MFVPRLIAALTLSASLALAQAPDSARTGTAPGASDSSLSAAKAVKPASEFAGNGEAQDLIRSGNSLVSTGIIMAGGGLLVGGIGNGAQLPYVGLAGAIAASVGIPILGVGAGKINHGAEMLNPSYSPNYRGWGWYWTGMGLDVASTYFAVSGVRKYNRELDRMNNKEDAVEAASGDLLLALGLGLGSSVCKLTGLVKFAILANEGRRAARGEGVSMGLAPQVILASDGTPVPGVALTLGF